MRAANPLINFVNGNNPNALGPAGASARLIIKQPPMSNFATFANLPKRLHAGHGGTEAADVAYMLSGYKIHPGMGGPGEPDWS